VTSLDPLAGARFTIAAPDELRIGAALDTGDDVPLAELRVRVSALAHHYVDTVLDGFVLALARAVRGVPTAGSRTAGVVRGFADRFVAPGVRRAGRHQIEDFVGFLRHHVARAPGREPAVVVAFAVDEDFAAALTPALAAAAAGAPTDREALHPALHAMVDECLHHLLDAPLALLHLGLLARAAIAVGRSGIGTRAHTAIDGVLEGPDDTAVARLAAFLGGALVAADELSAD